MPQEHPVTVQIYHQKYTLSNAEAQSEYIDKAATYLDKKMHAAEAAVGPRAPLDIAVLAAMEIASEILAERHSKDTLIDQTDEQISRFTERLENQHPSPLDTPSEPEDDAPAPPRF
jgi:cell division protein ZapA (FtsZ GTPase activity inhibitor)